MRDLKTIYKGRFFARRKKLLWRVPLVCNAVIEVLHPETIIDVGCAIGDYVDGFVDRGVDAVGLEGSTNVWEYLECEVSRVFVLDLRTPINIHRKFDVALCLEVAEHIEPEYADVFVKNLVALSDTVVMSAAIPGQRGHYHVNCQEPPYWIGKFSSYGLTYNRELVEAFKMEWTNVRSKREMRSYHDHLFVFQGG